MSHPTIIIQARMGGERFPGKVLAPVQHCPMLVGQLHRLGRVRIPGLRRVVACPSAPANTLIERWCASMGVPCYLCPDPEEDVLARIMRVARVVDADPILRVTGDCPLLDPGVVEDLYAQWMATPHLDHLGIGRGWADGQDVEMMSVDALWCADSNATTASDREHVTPYLWRQPEAFQCATLPCPRDCAWQQYSVDTPDDLALVDHLAGACRARQGEGYGWETIDEVLCQTPYVRELHDGRPARNHRYVAQVSRECASTDGQNWLELRYGS